MAQESIPVFFKNSQGITLSGRLETNEAPTAYAIYAHCFTCTKNITAAHVISKTLAALGIATLRFDFMGLGESAGDFTDSCLSSNIDDILSADAYLRQQYKAPTLLIGHSLGGLAALYAAQKLPDLKGCVTLNAPSSTKHTRTRVVEKDPLIIEQQGFATLDILGKHYKVRPNFDADLQKYESLSLNDLVANLLVVHIKDDTIVPNHHGIEIFQTASCTKSLIMLDKMDHLFKNRLDAETIATLIHAWF
ncbi:MAG: hypothetical protein NEHIOOID_00011 [Holosporales bacterium]